MAKEEVKVPEIKGKTKDGKEVSYRIKTIGNGFLVTRSFEWKDKDGDHHYESEDYFVKTDPVKKEADNIFDIMEAAISDTEF